MDLTAKQIKGLRKLAGTFPAFFILRYFRSLQRSRSYHTCEYLQQVAGQGALQSEREDLVPAYWEVLEVVKQLDALELGTYVQGRKGHKTRVEWSEGTCLSELGMAALPDLDEAVAELDLLGGKSGGGDVKDVHLRSDTPNLNEDMCIEHSYQLRPGLYLDFAVPRDLTSLEARRLAAFVGTLSMES